MVFVTVQEALFREVFWHEYAKIPRIARKNLIAEGDFYWIFAHNCEGTEQLLVFIDKGIFHGAGFLYRKNEWV